MPRPDAGHVRKLAELEDHDVTNQFSAIGSVKPGLFRRWTVSFLAWLFDYGARHIYNRGYLTRVQTIHFARWVFLDGKQRLFFASNYDGSLESYMDDFINKVAWGLNLVFSNGVGYPRTRWLIQDGAKDEQKFKFYIRRHELATEVWYKAYPGLSAVDLERNTKIREGIERAVDDRCRDPRVAELGLRGRWRDALRAGLRRYPGPGSLRLRQPDRGLLPAGHHCRPRRRTRMVVQSAGRRRGEGRSPAANGSAGGFHARRVRGSGRTRRCRREIFSRVPFGNGWAKKPARAGWATCKPALPSRWRWGGPGRMPHLLLLLYATAGRLDEWMQAAKGESWDSAFRVLDSLPTSNNQGVEPFGFTDGISQPELDWNLTRRASAETQPEYGNLVALGEFVLGYPNEYAKYTDRPLLDAKRDPSRELPARRRMCPARSIWGATGHIWCYDICARTFEGSGSSSTGRRILESMHRRKLAEAMVGRTMSGEPLVPRVSRPIEGVGPDPTDVKSESVHVPSRRCGHALSVRRSYPPGQPTQRRSTVRHDGLDLAPCAHVGLWQSGRLHDDLVASTRFHRLLRRGRKYGAPLSPEQALEPGRRTKTCGLYFVSLNANIARQFEFVQNAWIMGTKFDGLSGESDPLLGNREPTLGGHDTGSYSAPPGKTGRGAASAACRSS